MNTDELKSPLLRFPKYCIANNIWEEQKVGDVVNTISPPKKLQVKEFHTTGKYPIIDQSQKKICGYSDDDSAVINGDSKGMVVFGDHTCILKFIDFPFIQGADGIKIMISNNPNTISTRYLFQFLNAFPIESKEYKRHFSELKEKTLLYPMMVGEQTNIADCLFTIDSYISSVKEKMEQLKEHKKSLRQKLFPQNGKTVPEYRFPEFKKSGVWEEVKMGDVFSRIRNKNVKNVQNVLTISAQNGLVSQYEFFHKNVAASDLTNYYLIRKGDFAYNKSRSQGYPYGVIKPLRLYEEGVVSTLYICFRIKSDNYLVDFFEQYFETGLINKEIGVIAQEGARNHGLLNISTDDFFNKIILTIPPSVHEQYKIASTLSSIDKLINNCINKINLMKKNKKGLMQQLFPTSK